MTDKAEGKRWEDPGVLLKRLIAVFPTFDAHWRSVDNVATNEDGSFTCCGVLMEFGFFFRERYEQFPVHCVAELGAVVSECADSSNEELSAAACTCFLENMSRERFYGDFRLHLTGPARRFYDAWNA